MILPESRLPSDVPGLVRQFTSLWRQLATLLRTVDSGTYTPTVAAQANVAAVTSHPCQWMRVGSVVTVSGAVDIDPTTAGTLTKLSIPLPIASTLAAVEDCAGVAAMREVAGSSARIYGDSATNTAVLSYTTGTDVALRGWSFHFTYRVLP